MTINVAHIKRVNMNLSSVIRVDRYSPLGNPFELINEANRDICIQSYKEYLYLVVFKSVAVNEAIKRVLARHQDQEISPTWLRKHWTTTQVKAEFYRLKTQASLIDITLVCWCKPKSCHADVIKSAIAYSLAS